ncbi:hypothetical protein [Tortoise microvirus 30]|nr:hypothetical protein [Tortoise microvirus 30]
MLIKETKLKRKIITQNDLQEVAESLLNDKVTDPTGYIPLRNRIEAFEAAGQNLEEWRDQNFDYESWEEEDIIEENMNLGQYAIRRQGSDIVEILNEQEAAYFNLLRQTKQPRRRDLWEEEADDGDPKQGADSKKEHQDQSHTDSGTDKKEQKD